jgi:hypothetical protein
VKAVDISKVLLNFIGGLSSKNLLVILLSISLASGVLLFSRDDFLKHIGLDNFQAQFEEWIGVTFLVSTVLLVSVLAATLFQWAQSKYSKSKESRRRKTKRTEILQTLTPAERGILRRYVLRNTQTQYFNIGDGVVAGLEHKGIIYKATQVGYHRSWAYNITPWAWEFLKKHLEVLITKELMTLDKQEVAQMAKDMEITEEEVKVLIKNVLQEVEKRLARGGDFSL